MPRTLKPDEILPRLLGSVARTRILELLVSQAGRAFYPPSQKTTGFTWVNAIENATADVAETVGG